MFHSARLKLTAWYLLIIMLISLTFSAVIYKGLVNEVERFERAQRFRIERRLDLPRLAQPIPASPELIEEIKQRILLMLVFINCGILAIAGGFGYLLAGRTLKPIKEMVEEQNRFISDASHELRTPLTSLKSAFEVYLRDKHPTLKEARTLVGESVSEINKLQSLSDSLLQLAQYQKPNNQIKFEKISLTKVVKEAIHRVEPLAKEKRIRIENTTQETKIEGIKFSLADLLVILFDNAIKYSEKNSKVTISSTKTDRHILVHVADCGIGINKKDLPYIFERFYRADSTRSKTKANGYGLGLSIAKEIVILHHGSINAESNKQKGTTFTVKLPLSFS